MRALLTLAMLLPGLAAAEPLLVHVRVEGAAARVFDGWVALPERFEVVAGNSGRVHVLDGRTPLGALWAAAQHAGFDLFISDEFDDLEPLRVAGEVHWSSTWWDYRVDWGQTNYGPQRQWLAWGGPAWPLRSGVEVLWYPETHFSAPLRLGEAARGDCVRALAIDTPALDPLHQPGQPWPALTWRPMHLARLAGGSDAPVVGGVGVAAGPDPVWAEEVRSPVPPLYRYVRSQPLAGAC